MTYTTASGVVIPAGTDAFSPTAQFKTWADKAATYESRVVVALDTDRTALAAPVLRDGLECYVKATRYTWIYEGTTWGIKDSGLQTHAATFNNLTVGNGTVEATYQRFGKSVRCQGSVKIGTTSTIGSSPQLVLPFAGIAKYAVAGSNYILGQTGMLDRGSAFYAGLVFTQGSATWVQLAGQGVSGAQVAITATSPFSWAGASNDELSWNFWYEAA